MKNILFLPILFIAFFFSINDAFAQPSVVVTPGFQQINVQGSEVCVQFVVNDFTDITSISFDIEFDEDKIQYSNYNVAGAATNLEGYNPANSIITTDVATGKIRFEWVDPTPTTAQEGEDLADGTVLFELCFTTIDDLGFSEIKIVQDKVTRDVSGNFNIGFDYTVDGWIQLGNIPPVSINIPTAAGLQGETVCLNLTAENFEEVLSFQMTLMYDSESLANPVAQGVEPATGGVFDFAYPSPGIITMSWFDVDAVGGGTIPDGTSFVQVCFDLVGDCTTTSVVEVVDQPTISEAVTVSSNEQDSSDNTIGVISNKGAVTIDCEQPGAPSFCIPDISDICPGESFSMQVTAENFESIRQMDFSIQWNPSVLQLDDITETTLLQNFAINENQGGGYATCNWQTGFFPSTLPNGHVVFTMDFTVVGGGGSSTTVSITGTPTPIFFADQPGANAEHIGYNSCNALFQACSPTGITISAENATIDPQESFCIDVTVQDFDNINQLTFPISFDPSVATFTGISNMNLEGLTMSDFSLSGAPYGLICLNGWTSNTGVSVPDGTTIFSLCFDATNNALACEDIFFTGPQCEQSVNQVDVGFDIGMNTNNGTICLSNPDVPKSIMSSTGGAMGSFVVLDVTVENFNNLNKMEYSINFNPTLLNYLSAESSETLPNFSDNNIDATDAANGNLVFDWSNVTSSSGISLADGTEVYRLRFQIIGDLSGCTPVSFSGTPTAINVNNANNNTVNLGMEYENGEVCALQALVANANITEVSCPTEGSCDGAIDLTVTGGSGNSYQYLWTGVGIMAANETNEDQTGLCEGVYAVRISDINTGLILEEVYTVGLDPNGTFAIAGQDTTLQCGMQSLQLDVSNNGTSVGADFTYEWTSAGNVVVIPGTENSLTPNIGGCGSAVVLTVTNQVTGCVATDEVEVICASTPVVNGGMDMDYNCNTDFVSLDGTESSMGSEFTVTWTTEDGVLIAGTEDSYTPKATAPGTYILTILNNSNNCSGQDTVVVVDIRQDPLSVANVSGALDCDSEQVQLDGTGSATGTDYTYRWLTPSMSELSVGSFTAMTSEAGYHFFEVTDTTSGCIGLDSVLVEVQDGLPMANAGQNINWYCSIESVTLMGQETMGTGTYSYMWTGPGNISDPTSLTPTVDAFGTYTLMVTNDDTGCSAPATMQVVDRTAPPTADAGADMELTCAITELTLDGTASDSQASYSWSNADGTQTGIVSGETTNEVVVNAAGSYILTVTDTESSCPATDMVEVTLGAIPQAVIATTTAFLNCEVETITLDATASSVGDAYEYIWTGGCIDDMTDVQQPVISCAGTYTLLVRDAVLNCDSEVATITITEDTQAPTISTESVVAIACGENNVMLDATMSSSGDEFMANWVVIDGTPQGTIEAGETTLTPTVTAGSYGLTIVNNVNQCSTNFGVVVNGNSVNADAGSNVEIPCQGGVVSLDGSASTGGTQYAWTLNGSADNITGADTATPEVSETGTYVLTFTDAQGCSDVDSVQVIGINPPVANAGIDMPISCADDFITLDGSASDMGDNITYMWATLNGSISSADVTMNMLDVNGAGEYILRVDRADGCFSTDTVSVYTDNSDLPPAGPLNVEHEFCSNEAIVSANLPNGTTGLWISNNPLLDFAADTATMTTVSNIPGGEVLLIWTLSNPNCPNYDADTVLISTAYTPNVVNDEVDFLSEQDELTINLFENDVIDNIPAYTFTNTDPSIGALTNNDGDGMVTYVPQVGSVGAAVFDYSICNEDCPTLCDTAMVTINLDGEINSDKFPNTITPNGDGMNDVLIFDVLNSGNFPQNSLIIFNRWGDEVFQAQPYNNDWGGTLNGKLLPEATYYYILRLSLGNGEVIKGDITILK